MRALAIGIVVMVAGALLRADTLVLRDGTRVIGRLVGAEKGVITFEQRSSGNRRILQDYEREDVLRIEFDRDGFTPGPVEPSKPSRPSGLRERVVNVAANTHWTDTGITIRPGAEIWLESGGRVQWGRDRRHGPAGEPGSPRNDNRPMPSRNAAALIGKVGADSTDFFFIGDDEGPIRMRAGGRLFLGINDDYLQDNSGSFRVIVYY